MLTSFHIENLFLIDSLELDVSVGFTAVTGESGSGKSMIVRSLSLLAGQRISGNVLREDATKGFVEATFRAQAEVSNQLEKICGESAEYWTLRREFRSDGRSRGFINDNPVPLSELQTASTLLMRFSLQEETGLLRDPYEQLKLLDAYANTITLVAQVETSYRKYATALGLHESLTRSVDADERVLEWNRIEHTELTELRYEVGERESLRIERDRLRNREALIELYRSLIEKLDGEYGGITSIGSALHTAEQITRLDERASEWCNRIESALIDVRELVREVHDLIENELEESDRLSQIDDRLQQISSAERKWKLQPDEFASRIVELEEALASYDNREVRLLEAERDCERALSEYAQYALELRAVREAAGDRLCKDIERELPQLGLSHPRFELSWIDQDAPKRTGSELVEFRFSANPDIEPCALDRAASGGELARLELALLALADLSDQRTIILDEIDRGVSGRIATAIGKSLRKLGLRRSVFMVTHLPQVAAASHHHFAISKRVIDQRTTIFAEALTKQTRVERLAEMLSGDTIGSGALQGAEELLKDFE